MSCKAYVKEDNLFVHFNGMSIVYDGINFPLGDAAANFSALPEPVYEFVLTSFRDAYLKLFDHGVYHDEALKTLKELAVASNYVNPYLNFYIDSFIVYLLCPFELRHELPNMLRDFLVDNGKDVDLVGVDAVNHRVSSERGLKIYLKDFKKRQARLKEDFEAITGNAEIFDGLTPMQRLYLLSRQGRNYLSGEFKTTLAPDYINMPKGNMKKIKSTLIDNKVDIVEMVGINTIDDLLGYELFHMMKADLPMRKCKHCGEFFIVRGRIDTEYCDRVKAGESKRCSIIGATRSYWESKHGNAVYVEFQKAYKRNHSRQRVGKMTNLEFYEWSEEARNKRDACEAGELSLDDFKLWLGNK